MPLCVECKNVGCNTSYREPCASCYSATDERGVKTKPNFKPKSGGTHTSWNNEN